MPARTFRDWAKDNAEGPHRNGKLVRVFGDATAHQAASSLQTLSGKTDEQLAFQRLLINTLPNQTSRSYLEGTPHLGTGSSARVAPRHPFLHDLGPERSSAWVSGQPAGTC
jgi:hypothetical protein